MDWTDGGASAGIGVERPLLEPEYFYHTHLGASEYLEAPDGTFGIPLGFRKPSSLCVRSN